MKRFLLNRGTVSAVFAVACVFALRPSFLLAAAVPPQAEAQVSPAVPADTAGELAAFFAEAGYRPEEARAVLEQLNPAQRALLAENRHLLESGGSALGLVLGIALVVGIIALILRFSRQRLTVETSMGR